MPDGFNMVKSPELNKTYTVELLQLSVLEKAGGSDLTNSNMAPESIVNRRNQKIPCTVWPVCVSVTLVITGETDQVGT